MGGLVGIGFSIRINPTHTKIHVFITTLRASRLFFDPQNWRAAHLKGVRK